MESAKSVLYFVFGRFFFGFGMIGILSGCSPVKGYSGPDLPPEKISTVSFSYNSSDTDYDGAEMDGVAFGYSGINVLPGPHRYSFGATAKDAPFDCRNETEMDHYGYEKCLKKNDRQCDCFDYLSVYEECYREIYEGRCEGELTTQAGVNYSIQIQRDRESARAYVTGGGEARCSGFRRRIDTERSSKGTGRGVAYSAGVRGCY